MSIEQVPFEARKETLARIFAAFWVSGSKSPEEDPIDLFAAEHFLGRLYQRAQSLAKKSSADSGLIKWLLNPNILDEFWEYLEKLGTQRPLGVVTFSSDFAKKHRAFLIECENKFPGLFRLVQRSFAREQLMSS